MHKSVKYIIVLKTNILTTEAELDLVLSVLGDNIEKITEVTTTSIKL